MGGHLPSGPDPPSVNNDQLPAILDGLTEAVFLVDHARQVLFANRTARELFGKRKVIHFTGEISKNSVELKELGTGFLMFPIEERAVLPEWKCSGIAVH